MVEVKTFYISGKIELINVNDISFSNLNYKKIKEEEILNLAANIKRNGLIDPIYLRKDINNKDKYILVSGRRRLLALKILRCEKIPSIVFSLTDDEGELISLLKNQTKRQLTIFEKAEGIGNVLKNQRIKKIEVAEILGITLTDLDQILNVLKIDEQTRNIIETRKLDKEFIFLFLEFSPEEREKIINHILVKDLSCDMAVEYLLDLKNPKEIISNKKTLNNEILISNSIENIAKNLNKSGIVAFFKKEEGLLKTSYILEVLN